MRHRRHKYTLWQRFWAKVDKSGTCWLWTGAKSKAGYGVIRENADGRTFLHYAHILSYIYANQDGTTGYEVCHTCNNPSCVFPGHLYKGTHKQNMAQMCREGRHRGGVTSDTARKGEDNPASILAAEQVLAIRREYVPRIVTQQALADRYGVHIMTINDIIHRRRWGHLV